MEQTAGERAAGEDNQGQHQLCPKQGTARMGGPKTFHVGYKPLLVPWPG